MSESKHRNLAETVVDRASIGWGIHHGHYKALVDAVEKALEAASSAPEPAVDVACKALARAMGLPADHPQGSNIAWLAGRAVALLEPAAADRAVLDELLTWASGPENTVYRIGETYYANEGDLPLLSADSPGELMKLLMHRPAEALVAASPDRYPAAPDTHPAGVAAPGGYSFADLARWCTVHAKDRRIGCNEYADGRWKVWVEWNDDGVGVGSGPTPEAALVDLCDKLATRHPSSALPPRPKTEVAAPPGEQWIPVDHAAAAIAAAWDDGYTERDPTQPNPYTKALGTRAIVEAAIAASKRRGTWAELLPAPPKGTP